VIAYSSFAGEPPADSMFGRPGQGASVQSKQTAATGVQVLCVNPAALGGGTAKLDTYIPGAMVSAAAKIATAWLEFPNLYTATCTVAGGASWLNVSLTAPSDPRPNLAAAYAKSKPPTFGYHGVDITLALGNLVQDIAGQEAAYQASAH
jgi:hypothetical protein